MKSSHRNRSILLPALFLTATAYAYWQYVKYALVAITIALVAGLILKLVRKLRVPIYDVPLEDIDAMDGLAFEYYIARLLVSRGYTNVSLTEQYDYGVDIVAEKGGVRWGIQTKRHSGVVKAEAVRQVVTGLRLYECDRAMVITNSTFSTVAEQLARGNDCILIDRSSLRSLVC
jgi:HJR/Mrr/RecB family endonuclease